MQFSNEKEFWSVGKSVWNRWHVRKASVESPEEYTIIEDLGPVKKKYLGTEVECLRDVKLEFHGNFDLSVSDDVIRLHTAGNPWLSVVTKEGSLYIKQAGVPTEGETGVAPIKIADNVLKASLCRAWVNLNVTLRDAAGNPYHPDQGFVCAYLQEDGSVWYRERKSQNGAYYWEEPIQITEAGYENTDVKAFRLNDFRLGIYAVGAGKIWISRRTYIGNTVKDEYVRAGMFNPDFFVFSNRDLEIEDGALLKPLSVTLLDSTHVDVEFNFPVFDYDPDWNDITWNGSLPAGQKIKSLTFQDTHLFIELEIPMPSPTMALSFVCRAANRKGYYVSEQAKPIWPELTIKKDQVIKTASVEVGEAKAGIESIVQSFSNIAIQTIQAVIPEEIHPILESDILFSNVQIQDIPYKEIEAVVTDFESVVVSFNNQQTGDVPV